MKIKQKNPYYFISKKDGSLVSVLDIYFPKKDSTRLAQIDKNEWSSISIWFPKNMHYGKDLVIADISSDTLSLLTQNKN